MVAAASAMPTRSRCCGAIPPLPIEHPEQRREVRPAKRMQQPSSARGWHARSCARATGLDSLFLHRHAFRLIGGWAGSSFVRAGHVRSKRSYTTPHDQGAKLMLRRFSDARCSLPVLAALVLLLPPVAALAQRRLSRSRARAAMPGPSKRTSRASCRKAGATRCCSRLQGRRLRPGGADGRFGARRAAAGGRQRGAGGLPGRQRRPLCLGAAALDGAPARCTQGLDPHGPSSGGRPRWMPARARRPGRGARRDRRPPVAQQAGRIRSR